jgi:iron complex transport system substrate-binding protein
MAGRKGITEPLNAIEQRGIPTALFRVETMDELYAMITRMGIITGASGRADDLVRSMQERVSRVQKKLGSHPIRPKVFFEVRYPNLLTAGQHSIVSEIISLAGGTNCVPLDKKLVRLSEEELLGMNPEVYLLQKGPMNPNPVLPQKRAHFRTIQAVKTGRVLVVDEHLFSRPGPETVTAIEMLADYLHPEE